MSREPEGYAVREARRDDLAGLPHLEQAASQRFLASRYPGIAAERPTSVAEFARWLERGSLFVAVDAADAPVGFAIAHPLDGEAYLHEIDVHPAHGRRGVGRRLIAHVGAWAARRGHTRLVLSTFADVAWNAPYYRRIGFVELGEAELGPGLLALRRRERAAGLDVSQRVFMQLALGPEG